ncbi:hypothetical protein DLH72_00455 [Candidatus Gracilibacteria bacterium]|nr:MAG: hypothetical protein DLH72_00455 [Candidatus Gracilibacteria bacterium]
MKKLLSIVFSSIIVLFLAYTSFVIGNGNNYEKPIFKQVTNSESYFKINEKIDLIENGDLKVKYINVSDKILSYKGSFNLTEEKQKTSISFEKGVFLVNINSLDKNYFISSEGFNLETQGPNTFFIDNTDSRVKIISIDSILKLNFLNVKSQETSNSIYLYPNQYIFFDPNKNFLIKNADLFRITQLLSLGYFNESIIKYGKINPEFKKIFLSKDENISKITSQLLLYLYFEIKEKQNEIKDFLSKKFFKIPGEDLMLKYSFLLLNKEKKAIYIKNKILKKIQNILDDKKQINNDNIVLIKNDLNELKNIKESDYLEIIEIIKYFSGNINTILKENIDMENFFLSLLNKDNEIKQKEEILKLNSTFYNYNFSKNNDFYSEVKDFVEIKSKCKINSNEKNYFVFFLNKLILANLKEENANFKNIIDIFKIYTKVGISYYLAENEEDNILKNKIIETGISNFDNIITEIITKLEKDYFIRNLNNLLESKSNKVLDKNSVNTLTLSIKDIYENFYIPNQNLLTNEISKKRFKNNLEKFEELRIAFTDYSQYLIKYDNKNKILDYEENISNNFSEINKENAKKFLQKFNYIKFSDENIEVMGKNFCDNPKNQIYEKVKSNPYCYKITNIEVGNGVILSFILYPNEFNKISNISIGGDYSINKGSYKMDQEEEKYKIYGENSEDKHNFKNFFVNVITGSNSNEKEKEIYEDKNKNNDNSLIRTLKNTTLLGKNGTLTKLKPEINVEYNNINVTETSDGKDYIIKIEKAPFQISTEQKGYMGSITSDYKYKVGKINAFFNPELDVLNEAGKNILLGNNVKISGFIDISKLTDIIKNLLTRLEKISKIVYIIDLKDNGESINIVYFPNSDKFQINSKNIKIFTVGDEIESITSFGKKILEKNEKIDNIEILLK